MPVPAAAEAPDGGAAAAGTTMGALYTGRGPVCGMTIRRAGTAGTEGGSGGAVSAAGAIYAGGQSSGDNVQITDSAYVVLNMGLMTRMGRPALERITRGEAGRPALFAGIGAVALGTLEFSIREHLGGYRSHTVLLAFIPTVVVHTALSLLLAVLGASALVAGFAPLVVDGALFAFLFKLLRARFVDARRERTFTGRR